MKKSVWQVNACTKLNDPIKAGSCILQCDAQEFIVGATILINRGGANEEFGKIRALGSIVTEEPLQNDHEGDERIEMVKNMLAEGIDTQVIVKVTGLSEAQIQMIQKN